MRRYVRTDGSGKQENVCRNLDKVLERPITRKLPIQAFFRCSAFGAAVGLQDFFAQAERFGRDFDHLVLGDELDGLFEVHGAGRGEAD